MPVQYFFSTPSVEEGPAGEGPLFSRYRLSRGITVLKSGGTYAQVRYPTTDQLAAADVAYLGGSTTEVDSVEASALNDAGYGIYIQIVKS